MLVCNYELALVCCKRIIGRVKERVNEYEGERVKRGWICALPRYWVDILSELRVESQERGDN